MKASVFLIAIICTVGSSYGQVSEDEAFEALKGKLPWPVDAMAYVHVPQERQIPNISYSPGKALYICSKHPMTIRACAAGVVSRVFDIEGSWSVLVKHGHYFLVYSNLSEIGVKRGDTIKMQQVLGKIATRLGDEPYELDLGLYKEGKGLDPLPWLIKRVPDLLTRR